MWLIIFGTICIAPVLRVAWRVLSSDGEHMAARRALASNSPEPTGRRHVMSDTRRPRSPTASDQRHALQQLLERMDERQAAGFREVHVSIQGLRDHLGRTDARVEGLAQDVQREVNHIDTRIGRMYETSQSDIAALRQALEEHENTTAKSAAEGAAEGVAKITLPSPDDQAAQWRRGMWSRMGAFGTFGLVVILTLKEVPLLLRAVGGFFAWLASVK